MSGARLYDKRRRDRFWVHDAVIDDFGKELGVYGIAVYCYLARRADVGGRSFPSITRMAEDLNCGTTKVKESLKQLAGLELMGVESTMKEDGSHGSNNYNLLDIEEGGVGRHTTEGGSPHDGGVGRHASTKVPQGKEPQLRNSPKGANTPEREEKDVAQTSSAAKDMTTLTVDRCRERGLDASPGQKTNWGTGWAKYLYVPEGQDPPTPEEAYDVLDEIVASAAGKRGKTGYWISVQNAAKRLIEGNVTDLPVKKDKIRYDSDGRKWVNGMMEA